MRTGTCTDTGGIPAISPVLQLSRGDGQIPAAVPVEDEARASPLHLVSVPAGVDRELRDLTEHAGAVRGVDRGLRRVPTVVLQHVHLTAGRPRPAGPQQPPGRPYPGLDIQPDPGLYGVALSERGPADKTRALVRSASSRHCDDQMTTTVHIAVGPQTSISFELPSAPARAAEVITPLRRIRRAAGRAIELGIEGVRRGAGAGARCRQEPGADDCQDDGDNSANEYPSGASTLWPEG